MDFKWALMAQTFATQRKGLIIAATKETRDKLMSTLNAIRPDEYEYTLPDTIATTKEPEYIADALANMGGLCKELYMTSPLNSKAEGHEFAIGMARAEEHRRNLIETGDETAIMHKQSLRQSILNATVAGDGVVPELISTGDIILRLDPQTMLQLVNAHTTAPAPTGRFDEDTLEEAAERSYEYKLHVKERCFLCAVPLTDCGVFGTGMSGFAVACVDSTTRVVDPIVVTADMGLLLKEFAHIANENVETLGGVMELDALYHGSTTHGHATPLI